MVTIMMAIVKNNLNKQMQALQMRVHNPVCNVLSMPPHHSPMEMAMLQLYELLHLVR